MSFLMFANVGDWIEGNIIGLIMLLAQLVWLTRWLSRVESATKQTQECVDEQDAKHEKLDEKFEKHVLDNDAHVNHLYMGTIKEQIGELKGMIQTGDSRIETQIQHLTREFYSKSHTP